jgi:hypothetical protein
VERYFDPMLLGSTLPHSRIDARFKGHGLISNAGLAFN